MANHVTEAWIDAQPVVPVETSVPNLYSADLLFFSGDGVLSKAIQRATKSPWDHVELVVRSEEWQTHFAMGAVEYGVRLAPLLSILRENNGDKIVAACVNRNLRSAVIKAGFAKLTAPYDIMRLVRLWWEINLRLREPELPGEKYICSEFAADCLKEGAGLNVTTSLSKPTPEDVWLSQFVVPMFRVK